MQANSFKSTIPKCNITINKVFIESERTENERPENEDYFSHNQVFQFSNCENKTEVNLRTAGPDQGHLTVCNGLNLSARCPTVNCRANKDGFWVKKGYGKFDIGRINTKVTCPICKAAIYSGNVKTLGYMKAKVTFEGVQIKDNKDVPFSKSDTADGDKFSLFSDADADMCSWAWLELSVEKL